MMEEDTKLDTMLSGLSKTELDKAKYAVEAPMSDKDKELVRMCENLFNFSKRHRQIYMERKAQCYLYYAGKQWNIKQPTFKSTSVTNVIWGIIEYEIPMMTENKPILKVMPVDPEDVDFAEGATKGIEFVWNENRMDYKLPFIARDFLIFGDAFLKTYYDIDLDKIIVDMVPSDYIYPEPYVSSISNMKYFIHAEPRPIYDIAEKYKNGKYVKPENISTEILDVLDEESSSFGSSESRESLEAEGMTTSREGGKLFGGRAIVKEMWLDDRTMVRREHLLVDDFGEPIYERDENGNIKFDKNNNMVQKKFYTMERKYPYGRVITWANGVLLLDENSPFSHGQAPFVHFHNIKLDRSFWSYGDPYQIISIQKQINKRRAQIDFSADLMGNSIWIVDADSGITSGQCQNRPGLVLYKRPGTEVRRESPPNIPEYMFRTIDELKADADFTVGLLGVVRGEKPGSVTADKAIRSLLERAMVRIQEKTKYMEKAIVDLANLWMSYMMQYWDMPRKFAIGNNGDYSNNFVEFSGASLRKKPLISIVAGSTMSKSKIDRYEQALSMFVNGVIDRKEFLSLIEYPNADVVLRRMDIEAQKQMQMQMQENEKERQMKLANYLARIRSAEIQSGAKVQGQREQAMAKIQSQREQAMSKLQGQREGQLFDFNKLLMGGLPQRGVGKRFIGV